MVQDLEPYAIAKAVDLSSRTLCDGGIYSSTTLSSSEPHSSQWPNFIKLWTTLLTMASLLLISWEQSLLLLIVDPRNLKLSTSSTSLIRFIWIVRLHYCWVHTIKSKILVTLTCYSFKLLRNPSSDWQPSFFLLTDVVKFDDLVDVAKFDDLVDTANFGDTRSWS